MKFILVSISALVLFCCSDKHHSTDDVSNAGFKTIQFKDTSRNYKPNTDTSDYLHFRPLDIDIWYPAKASTKDAALLFQDLLGLLETRANYYSASTVGNGIAQQIAHYFSDGLKCSDSTKVLNFRTETFKNASPVDAKFPLVIYLTAYNGMSYENFVLFEELAKNGFVVVSISSIGRFPGDMTMKKEDLIEQVYDAIASLHILKGSSNIDFTKIGIIGYSWGGLAGSVLASKIPGVACLISLDGSEFHHYGNAKEENDDFDAIMNSSYFKDARLSVPYLRLESSPVPSAQKEGSVYDFTKRLLAEKEIFKIDSAKHEDFGCLPIVVRKSGNCESKQYFATISRLTLSFLNDHLKNGNGFDSTVGHEMNRTIRRKL